MQIQDDCTHYGRYSLGPCTNSNCTLANRLIFDLHLICCLHPHRSVQDPTLACRQFKLQIRRYVGCALRRSRWCITVPLGSSCQGFIPGWEEATECVISALPGFKSRRIPSLEFGLPQIDSGQAPRSSETHLAIQFRAPTALGALCPFCECEAGI